MSDFRIDPDLGDYTLEPDGRPTTTTDLLQPAYIRLRAHLGRWLYDPALGSRYHELRSVRITAEVEASIVEFAEAALSPLLEDGRATALTVDRIEATRTGRRILGRITDNIDRLPGRLDVVVPIG